MKTCNYLYGVEKAMWHGMTYDEAIKHKIELARQLIQSLNKVKMMNRDIVRITRATQAIEFNEKLLKE